MMLMCAYISPRALQLVHSLSKKTWKITEDEESLNKESYLLYQKTIEYWGKVGRFADLHIYNPAKRQTNRASFLHTE
jgi:hypothetical protein